MVSLAAVLLRTNLLYVCRRSRRVALSGFSVWWEEVAGLLRVGNAVPGSVRTVE